jgi:hypothetical protein
MSATDKGSINIVLFKGNWFVRHKNGLEWWGTCDSNKEDE